MNGPLPLRYEGEGCFAPINRHFARRSDERFTVGEVYDLEPVEQRSDKTHSHEFAWLRTAWRTLPDHLAVQYPTEKHLRKRALIATNFCDTVDTVCTTRAEAERWAASLPRLLDTYAVVELRDRVVRVHTAKSQSRAAMDKTEFQASKTAILDWVSDLLGTTPEVLQRQGAGGANNPSRVAHAA